MEVSTDVSLESKLPRKEILRSAQPLKLEEFALHVGALNLNAISE
jgi:hypothetical protein